jgi:hypothetical protein
MNGRSITADVTPVYSRDPSRFYLPAEAIQGVSRPSAGRDVLNLSIYSEHNRLVLFPPTAATTEPIFHPVPSKDKTPHATLVDRKSLAVTLHPVRCDYDGTRRCTCGNGGFDLRTAPTRDCCCYAVESNLARPLSCSEVETLNRNQCSHWSGSWSQPVAVNARLPVDLLKTA